LYVPILPVVEVLDPSDDQMLFGEDICAVPEAAPFEISEKEYDAEIFWLTRHAHLLTVPYVRYAFSEKESSLVASRLSIGPPALEYSLRTAFILFLNNFALMTGPNNEI
jgi:hypothetical protein